jgi:hypothetical protein
MFFNQDHLCSFVVNGEKLGDYNRSTKEITLDSMPPEFKAALDAHIEMYELGPILDDALMCVETTSEKIKKGLFSGPGPKLLVQTVILTDRWLVLADRVDQNAVYIRTMQLRDITVEDYEKSQFHAMIPDSGVNLHGIATDTTEKGTVFLPLGKDSAGEKFKSALIEAAQDAKK